MESLWRKQTENITAKSGTANIKQLDSHWDVIVVGAGMAGLLTAFYLQEQGKKVLVLEANRIASGQTERTTAKITSQHGLKYSQLIKTIGIKKARLYAQANEAAIREYEQLMKKYGIACRFERVAAYLYTLEDEYVLREEAEAANLLGIDAFYTKKTNLPFPVKGAVCFRNQAQFEPLKFVRHIAGRLQVLEHTKVLAVHGRKVKTKDRVFTANHIVMATHYPFLNIPGFYFLRQHQERSYVLALSGCDEIGDMYYGIDKNGLSFRQAGDFLLLGGAACRTGKNEHGGAYDTLLRAAKKYYPDCKVEARWSAQDCMPHDGVPFIGRYSIFTPHLYVVTGFQKWGMSTAMVAAMILRDVLDGKKNPDYELFRPQRIHVQAAIGSLLKDICVSVKGISKGLCHKPKEPAASLQNGDGGIVTIAGKRCACYRDEAGRLHQISARCPHMGCELTWNPDEKSWDCPCHGSRFDVDGNLLDNPAL